MSIIPRYIIQVTLIITYNKLYCYQLNKTQLLHVGIKLKKWLVDCQHISGYKLQTNNII